MLFVTRLARFASALGLLLAAAPACGSDSTGSSDLLLNVGGPVTNRTGQPIPSTARVVIGWVVSSGPQDYTYIFGEGTVQGSSFHIDLRQPPPAVAINDGQIGVGVILLTTNTDVRSGVRLEDVVTDPADLLGATGRYAVIYKATEVVNRVDWADPFPLGYSAGVGVDRDNDVDAFQPVSPTSLELIVDLLDNIDFVNWT